MGLRRAGVIFAFASAVGCAALEGLDKYEKVDDTVSGGGTDAAPPGSSSASPTVTPTTPPPDAADATLLVARDAAPDAEAGSPDNPNLALLGVAHATSELPSYPASQVNDGKDTTSWYAAKQSCTPDPSGGYTCGGLSGNPGTGIEITLDQPRTVGRVRILGNRDAPTGYDVLTGNIELKQMDDRQTTTVVPFTTSRGDEPNGDAELAWNPLPNVIGVRVDLLAAESDEPGLAEIEIYGE
jgi:hypothetical protein